MKRYIPILFILMFSAGEVCAQYFVEAKPSEDIGQIKSHITQLLDDNKQLTQEHDALRQELYILQSKVDHAGKKFGKLEKDAFNERSNYQMSNESLKTLNGDIKQLQNELMIRKSRQTFLKAQMIDLDKKVDVWNLKKVQLEYEKREAEVEKKNQKLDVKDVEYERTYKQLKRDIKESRRQKKELLDQIQEIEQARLTYPQSVLEMKERNKYLKTELEAANTEKRFKSKEISILQDKEQLAQLQFNRDYKEYEMEHNRLTKEVVQLEKEYAQLNKKVDVSLSAKSKKRNIMQDIISLDKENQGLLNEINELQKSLQDQ